MLRQDIEFSFSETNIDKVFELVNKLKTKKASTSNYISTRILKENIDICGEHLLNIINCGMNTSNFDSNLKLADISPILKTLIELMQKNTALLVFYQFYLKFLKEQWKNRLLNL